MTNLRTGLVQKYCPKCKGGNVYLDSDQHGWFEHCLQCGYTRDMEITAKATVESTAPDEE